MCRSSPFLALPYTFRGGNKVFVPAECKLYRSTSHRGFGISRATFFDKTYRGRRDFSEGGAPVRPRSVLIVDDNPLIRKTLGDAFIREGDFEICGEAQNGRDAIEKAQQLHPALIIMDVSMPVLNGLDATRILTKLMPRVPVIIESLHGTSPLVSVASAVGAAAVVSKTDALTVLIGKARELLEPKAA